MSGTASLLYMLALTALGWGLSLLGWARERKWLIAIAAVAVVPLLILLPALLHRDGQFADLQWILGVTTLVWGAVAVTFGWCGAVLLRALRQR